MKIHTMTIHTLPENHTSQDKTNTPKRMAIQWEEKNTTTITTIRSKENLTITTVIIRFDWT